MLNTLLWSTLFSDIMPSPAPPFDASVDKFAEPNFPHNVGCHITCLVGLEQSVLQFFMGLRRIRPHTLSKSRGCCANFHCHALLTNFVTKCNSFILLAEWPVLGQVSCCLRDDHQEKVAQYQHHLSCQ
jgi:hypothetical protein